MDKYFNAIKDETLKLKSYLENNKKLIIIIIFFGLLAYGFSLVNFTVGVDTEYAISSQGSYSSRWIEQGRFGVGILKKIFSTNDIIPFRNTYLAITLMIVNTILLCYVLNSNKKKSNNILSIIMAILYVTSPIFVHNLYFTTYNFEIQIGILLCILACYMSSKYILDGVKNKVLISVAVLIMAYSVGIYQSFVSFFFALVCYKIIDHLIELKEENKIMKFKEFAIIVMKYAALMIVSMAVYYIIDKVSAIFIPKTSYTSQFIGWKVYSFGVVISNIKHYIKGILLQNVIVGTNIILYTTMISGALILYYAMFKKALRVYVPLLIMAIMGSPFIITVLLGTEMPYRTQQTLILITPLIFGIMYKTITNKYVRAAICGIVIMVGFNQTMYTNKLLYSDYARYEQDLDLTRQINTRVSDLGYTDLSKYKIMCIGKKETNNAPNIIKQELIGFSIYEWDDGNPRRTTAFMRDNGYNYIKVEREDPDIKKAKEFSANMPVWPNVGSIQLMDNNIIVVKLSE